MNNIKQTNQIPISSIRRMSQQELLEILEEADKAPNRDELLTRMIEQTDLFLTEPRYARDLGVSYLSGQGPLAEEKLQVAAYLLIQERLDLLH